MSSSTGGTSPARQPTPRVHACSSPRPWTGSSGPGARAVGSTSGRGWRISSSPRGTSPRRRTCSSGCDRCARAAATGGARALALVGLGNAAVAAGDYARAEALLQGGRRHLPPRRRSLGARVDALAHRGPRAGAGPPRPGRRAARAGARRRRRDPEPALAGGHVGAQRGGRAAPRRGRASAGSARAGARRVRLPRRRAGRRVRAQPPAQPRKAGANGGQIAPR